MLREGVGRQKRVLRALLRSRLTERVSDLVTEEDANAHRMFQLV